MATPTIKDAKDLAVKYRKRGVVILFVDDIQFGVASYGMRRRDCDDMRQVADAVFEAIHKGRISAT